MGDKPRRPRARKALGQHFLTDTGILRDIAEAVRAPAGGFVLEIGPGTGQLTEALLDRGFDVVALEVDSRMIAHLARRFAGREELQVVEADARTADLRDVLPDGPFSVAGNLPYFAANPIIRRFLEGEPRPAEMVVTVQREVAREIVAKPGKLSLLGISVQIYAEPEHLFDVPPQAFDPPPAVHSSVVRLRLRGEPLVPSGLVEPFFALVSGAFRNPRKQIHNALSRSATGDPERVDADLARAGIDPTRRPETLSIEEWLSLLEARSAVAGHV